MKGREITGRSGILRIADIDPMTVTRLRPWSEAGVQSVIASISDLGSMTDPIHVRLRRSTIADEPDRLELIAGGHRLEAGTRLGWETIPGRVWECSDDWARLKEIDDNLAGAELTPLDTAVFLVERKRLYEALHPGTTRGAAGRRAIAGGQTEPESVWSFVTATAKKFGMSERQIYKIIAAGQHLDAEDVERLRAGQRQPTLADLQQLSRVADPALRRAVVAHLHDGTARSAARALKAARGQDARAARDPSERAYEALCAAYMRAPKGVQMRFRRFLDRRGAA